MFLWRIGTASGEFALPAERRMSLTPELVARIHRDLPDPGFMPGLEPMQEADCEGLVAELLADHAADADLWLFAYGSLIWKLQQRVAELMQADGKGPDGA